MPLYGQWAKVLSILFIELRHFFLLLKGGLGDGREILLGDGNQFHKKKDNNQITRVYINTISLSEVYTGSQARPVKTHPYLDTEILVSRNPWNKEKQSILKTLHCTFIHTSEKYTLKILNRTFIAFQNVCTFFLPFFNPHWKYCISFNLGMNF